MFEQYSEKCGKLLFLTFDDAQRKVHEREGHPDWLKHNWTGKVYQCSRCHYFHISTVSKDDEMIGSGFRSGTTGDDENNSATEGNKETPAEKKRRIQQEKHSSMLAKKKAAEDYEKAAPVRQLIQEMDRRDGLAKNTGKNAKGSTKKNKNNSTKNDRYDPSSDKSELFDSFGSGSSSHLSDSIDPDVMKKLKKLFD